MRESNFAFPAQNRASVSISSQLYDRRALDSNSPLPLFNSLTHLTYLTSTSPRIREIMTYDGGLERLVQILRDFCLHPPPPDNPTLMYGLSPAPLRPPRRPPVLNPNPFDKHAAYRFSLAFQSIVNIGVRGSEEIRARVVQAGTLDVVGCILEAWLAGKGFQLGPSASSSSHPRETREQRSARRTAQAEARNRLHLAELERALRRQLDAEQRQASRAAHEARQRELLQQQNQHQHQHLNRLQTQNTVVSPIAEHGPESAGSASTSEANSDAETSAAVTPGAETPTGVVNVPGRDRSGTVIGRPEWETGTIRGRRVVIPEEQSQSDENSADVSRADTETEDDGENDVDMDRSVASGSSSPNPARLAVTHPRRAVGIVTDQPEAGPSNMLSDSTHIIIDADALVPGAGGVTDGLVALEPNDDFALGAPPGAPGAIDGTVPAPADLSPTMDRLGRPPPDATPRAMTTTLPTPEGRTDTRVGVGAGPHTRATIQPIPNNANMNANAQTMPPPAMNYQQHQYEHSTRAEGPYRDEDVLLGLQLLAYLSKYPHVRQAFYKPRPSFHPAAAVAPAAPPSTPVSASQHHHSSHAHLHARLGQDTPVAGSSTIPVATPAAPERHGFFRSLAPLRKDKRFASQSTQTPATQSHAHNHAHAGQQSTPAPPPQRMVNVFSLVERFTFRPSSSSESEAMGMGTMGNMGSAALPPEIQYWAGVIMRNACRKDDTKGGIRQCANMLCGRWETYPREFAKCRRCRKAKYCGKECQSTAWSEGHRFWCSAKDAEEEAAHAAHVRAEAAAYANAQGQDQGHHRVTITTMDADADGREATAVTVNTIVDDTQGQDGTPVMGDAGSVPVMAAVNALRRTHQDGNANTTVNANATPVTIDLARMFPQLPQHRAVNANANANTPGGVGGDGDNAAWGWEQVIVRPGAPPPPEDRMPRQMGLPIDMNFNMALMGMNPGMNPNAGMGVGMNVGMPTAPPDVGGGDMFVDTLIQHGFFGPGGVGGGGTAGEGMRVEDGVVRVDDDIVRVNQPPTTATAGHGQGHMPARTRTTDIPLRGGPRAGMGAEDAMMLD